MVDASKKKEMRAKDTIQGLRKEIDKMTVLLDKGQFHALIICCHGH